MQSARGSTLRVVSLPVDAPSRIFSSRSVALARPHPLLPGHVGVVDTDGLYHVLKLGEGSSAVSVVAVYELQLCADGGFTQPVRKEWRAFEHLPDDGLVLCQRGSGRILFAQLPLCAGEQGAVFLFGAHDGPVLSLAANRDLLLSGGADGSVRLWNLDNGAQVDCCKRHVAAAGKITAVAFVGSLMVAAGADQGTVTLYDISTSRFEAVQRFHAGEGPVGALASSLTPQQAHDVVTAPAPRGLDGGGVVGPPWISSASRGSSTGTDTLLAVASPAGWVHVYRAVRSGEDAWQLVHRRAVGGQPFLSASPDGSYLAVGAGASLEVLDARTFQVVLEQRFLLGPLAGAGFLPAAAGGSALVAMPRGATLAGGIRLRLYAAPAGEEPLLLQMTVPLVPPGREGQRDADAVRDEDFLSWLEHTATAPGSPAAASPAAVAAAELFGLSLGSPAASGRKELGPQQLLPGASQPARNPAWGWQAFVSSGSGPDRPGVGSPPGWQLHGSSSGGGALGGSWIHGGAMSASERPPWGGAVSGTGAGTAKDRAAAASPLPSGTEQRSPRVSPGRGRRSPPLGIGSPGPRVSGAAGSDSAAPALEARAPGPDTDAAPTWQVYRPATQPAPRSWLTGLPPRADFLPQPMSPQQPQQPRPEESLASGVGAAPGGPAVLGHTSSSPASRAAVGWGGSAHEGRDSGLAEPGPHRRDPRTGPIMLSPAKDDYDETIDGFTEQELELPHSGTLLPAAGIPAVASSANGGNGRYGVVADDGDEDEAALQPGEKGPQQQPPQQVHALKGTRVAGTPGPGHRSCLGQAAGAAGSAGQLEFDEAEQMFGPEADERVEVREVSFAQGGWARQPNGSGGAGGTGAAWRQGDMEITGEDFRQSMPAEVAAAAAYADDGNLRGGGLGDSFRFRPLQQQPAQQQQHQRGHEAALPQPQTLYQLRQVSNMAAWPESTFPSRPPKSNDAVTREYAPDSGTDAPASNAAEQPTLRGGESGDSVPVDATRDSRDIGEPADPLGRAAYFGDALIKALQEGSDAGGKEGGQSATVETEALLETVATADEEDDIYQEEVEEQDDIEEEENPLPRASARLPTPQPEWSQQRLGRSPRPSVGEQHSGGEPTTSGDGFQREANWGDWENADVLSGSAGACMGLPVPTAKTGRERVPGSRPAPQPRQPPPAVTKRLVMSSPGGTAASSTSQTTAPARQRPALSVFKSFKPNHAKVMQQLRKAADVQAAAAGASALGGPLGVPPRCRSANDGDAGDEMTAESGVSTSGPATSPHNERQSSSVLLGSPNASATTAVSAPRRPPGGLQDQHQAPQEVPQPGPGAHSSRGGGQRLQHLRQLRHAQHRHQLTLRHVHTAPWPHASAPEPSERPQGQVPSRRPLSSKPAPGPGPAFESSAGPRAQVGQGPMRPHGPLKPPGRGAPQAGSHDAAQVGAITTSEVVVEDDYDEEGSQGEADELEEEAGGMRAAEGVSPLQVPQLGSTGLLLRKMQTLGQVLTRPGPIVARTRPRSRGRGRGTGVGEEPETAAVQQEITEARAAGMNEAAWEEATRRAATGVANVPPAAQLYRDLPPLDDPAQQQQNSAKVPKQLHPAWVASRQVKPELETLWRPADYAHEVCNTRGVALYVPPSTAEVALHTLSLQWLC